MKHDDEMKLTSYALGELSEEERAAIEARVWNDAAARAEVDAIRELAKRLGDELAAEAVPAAKPIDLEQIRRRRQRGWGGRLAIAAAVSVVVGGLAFSVLTPRLNRARESSVAVRMQAEARDRDQNAALQKPIASQPQAYQAPKTPSPSSSAQNKPFTLGHVPTPVEQTPVLAAPAGLALAPAAGPDGRPAFSLSAGSAPTAAPFGVPGQAVGANVVTGTVNGGTVFYSDPKAQALAAAPNSTLAVRGSSFQFKGDNRFGGGTQLGTSLGDGADRGLRARGEAELRRENLSLIVPDDAAGGFNTEAYDRVVDNPFLQAMQNPLSTFSIDVDTASYSNVRRFLTGGQKPPKDAVRIEELVNYFPYDYAPPKESDEKPFATHVEVAACPWQPEHRLVRVGIKGKEIAADKRPASNLVFLLDVSGSMQPDNKLPMVKRSMRMLLDQLGGEDRVAIVVYAGSSGLVLPSTSCSEGSKEQIRGSIEELRAGGSTNGEQGIQLAYSVAQKSFIQGGTNRVILCTDGDFNVGVTNQGDLTRVIEEKAKAGVFLSVLGFGMGNLKDSTMEKLADKGNGNYAYIDTITEAKKVLVEQMSGTLVTIAKDVKIQVEFNPAVVGSYRLIGYENRMLAKEDFSDDKKDAGEIGAGHAVTALYEVMPVGVKAATAPLGDKEQQTLRALDESIATLEKTIAELRDETSRRLMQKRIDEIRAERRKLGGGDAPPVATTRATVDPLRYQKPATPTGDAEEMLTLKLRYKKPDGDVSTLIETPVKDAGAAFAKASADFKFASAVAAFGMILRESPHKGGSTYGAAIEWAEDGVGADRSGYRAEFIELVKRAKTMAEQ